MMPRMRRVESNHACASVCASAADAAASRSHACCCCGCWLHVLAPAFRNRPPSLARAFELPRVPSLRLVDHDSTSCWSDQAPARRNRQWAEGACELQRGRLRHPARTRPHAVWMLNPNCAPAAPTSSEALHAGEEGSDRRTQKRARPGSLWNERRPELLMREWLLMTMHESGCCWLVGLPPVPSRVWLASARAD